MRRRAANPSGALVLGGALGLWSIIEIHRSQRSSPVCSLDCRQLPHRPQWCDMFMHIRRKSSSQTSDNVDRFKKQRWEESEKRKEEEKRERESLRAKKIPKREKVEKS